MKIIIRTNAESYRQEQCRQSRRTNRLFHLKMVGLITTNTSRLSEQLSL